MIDWMFFVILWEEDINCSIIRVFIFNVVCGLYILVFNVNIKLLNFWDFLSVISDFWLYFLEEGNVALFCGFGFKLGLV